MMHAPADELPVRFLKLILPEQGHFVAAIKPPKQGFKPSIFAATVDELWETIETSDRNGCETYYACSSFKEDRNDPPWVPPGQRRFGRTKHNVLCAKAFWLDVDVGPNKPYKTLNEAVDAVKAFCDALGLPIPVCVGSGSGLHVYWPLHEAIDRTTWELYAKGLKKLCDQHGLKADHARTTDISSVMRVPGTHNRKYGSERLVECSPEFLNLTPSTLEQLAAFAQACAGARQTKKQTLLAHAAVYPSSYAAEIVKHCGQLQHLRDDEGNLDEPVWHACLGVLAFCEDGDTLAHEWSEGDDRYTREETQKKLEQWRALTGPTTCKRFHELNPSVCEQCKHWGKIKSPITLGYRNNVGTHGALRWERTKGGALKPNSYINAATALKDLDVNCTHDVFHDRKIVEGDIAENVGPELSDAICRALREKIVDRYGVDFGLANIQQATERACEATRFNPVKDYLDKLKWDGTSRLDNWVVKYLGCEDTPLNCSIGQKMLIALVRRAREPGCKFDYVVILEGPQGSGKSTALRIIAGDDNFSDMPILHLETRAQQEAVKGKWIVELSELAGLRRTEIEAVKSFISRQDDNARPAYGRFRVDQPRCCIFVGTTNDDQYLRDITGNRRFWPLKTGKIDLDALLHDRDQLLAEAAHDEAQGKTLVISEELWAAAAAAQDQRLMQDPWEDLLADVKGTIIVMVRDGDKVRYEERIASKELYTRLGLIADRLTDLSGRHLRVVMNKLGWEGPKAIRIDGKVTKGYCRVLKQAPLSHLFLIPVETVE
jgi:hypothetical protein